MRRLKAIGAVPAIHRSLPALSFVEDTPHLRYKFCLNEQTTLAGKKQCYQEYRSEKSEE